MRKGWDETGWDETGWDEWKDVKMNGWMDGRDGWMAPRLPMSTYPRLCLIIIGHACSLTSPCQ